MRWIFYHFPLLRVHWTDSDESYIKRERSAMSAVSVRSMREPRE